MDEVEVYAAIKALRDGGLVTDPDALNAAYRELTADDAAG